MIVIEIEFGILSLFPPAVAILLALITKEVVFSLLIGILTGTFIYTHSISGNFLTDPIIMLFEVMKDSFDINIVLFLALLGCLVAVVNKAGGSNAYASWASTKIKSKRLAQLATFGLGTLIFIDDYFNCLTVGTVMSPVTDKHKISRAKLAYIVDSTAAPICIIAPISSWAAAISNTIDKTNSVSNELETFIQTIPYNLYAILSIILVLFTCIFDFNIGPLKKVEEDASSGNIGALESFSSFKNNISKKGKVYDLIIPIFSLIFFSVLAMLYTGGFSFKFSDFFSVDSIKSAFGDCDSSLSLVLGGFMALLISFILFIPRKIISFNEFMCQINKGIKTMVPAFVILTLAWTLGGICRDYLQTGTFIGNIILKNNFPISLFPAAVFIFSAFLSFSTGTAWGTFNILIPIIVEICTSTGQTNILVVSLSAVLAGSVFGDHASPISDTTILSSTGSSCDHLLHVKTQFIYAIIVAICSVIGYIVSGFTNANLSLTLLSAISSLVIFIFFLKKKYNVKL